MKYLGTEDESKIGTLIHPFTVAGMGEGPFQCVGFRALGGTGPLRIENGRANFETCKHCGAAIQNVFVVQNAKGDRFPVGSTCIEKVEPRNGQMIHYISAVKQEQNRVKSQVKHKASQDAMRDFLHDETVIAKAKSLPHPRDFKDFKTGASLTYFDYMVWMAPNCGHAGRTKYLKLFKTDLGL